MTISHLLAITFLLLMAWSSNTFFEKSYCIFDYYRFAFKRSTQSLNSKNYHGDKLICAKRAHFSQQGPDKIAEYNGNKIKFNLEGQMDAKK